MIMRPATRPRLLVLALASALLTALVGGAAAQESPRLSARDVAGLLQAFYDQTTTLETRFAQRQYTKVYDRVDEAAGRVVFKKPGRMRWDYDAPNGQVFVSDGRTLTIYQPPEEGERVGQVLERPVSDDQLPAAFSFLTGTGRLGRDFRMRLLDPARQGWGDVPGGYVLECRPRQASPHYERVLFYVRVLSRGERQAAVIQRVLIVDGAGNTNRFDFEASGMRFDGEVPDERFAYEPPAGTRRVRP